MRTMLCAGLSYLTDVLFCVKLFRLNAQGQLGYGERCIDSTGGNALHVQYCPVEPSGPWRYDKVCMPCVCTVCFI